MKEIISCTESELKIDEMRNFEILTNPGIYAGGGSVKSEMGFSPKYEKVGLKSLILTYSISGINAGVSHVKRNIQK